MRTFQHPKTTIAMTHTARSLGTDVDLLCVNTVRTLAMDAVQKANSGHPGAPMGLAPLGYVLWTRHLKHNPVNPGWADRDRFVLSAGHASMLLYSLLYLTGYELSLEDIKNFRQWGSKTPGHPEAGHTPGVETTTGPLGQGLANAVGMALAEARLAEEFNLDGHDIVDHNTYFIVGDGDLMEGLSHEAASLAGHLRLGKIIGFFDNNGITIDGSTDLSCSDDVAGRFKSYGWHVLTVADGNDLEAIDSAITEAKEAIDRPSLIVLTTHIGFGSPNKQDTGGAHGAPLGVDEILLTKQNLGWESEGHFVVPDESLSVWRGCVVRGKDAEAEHKSRWDSYAAAHPSLAGEFQRRMAGLLPDDWEDSLPVFNAENGAIATRAASGKVINGIARVLPELFGGSADLAGSNLTDVNGQSGFSADDRGGRNLHFGIREHGMGGVMNGMALHGGFIPYGGTFLVFSDYMRGSIRLAALMGLKVVYVFTHDSIGLGEDGPTHQPVEHLAALRLIPGLTVIRPADASETVEAWKVAVTHSGGPVVLALTRQKVGFTDRSTCSPAAGLASGGYVLRDPAARPQVVIVASGSEVEIAMTAADELKTAGLAARVVSMPCLELFDNQAESYRKDVLPPDVPRIAIEAAHPMPWYRIVGDSGLVIGIDRFGASAPGGRIYQELGITASAVVTAARELVGQ